MKNSVIFLLVFFVFIQCKKTQERTCWKKAGAPRSLSVDLPDNFSGVAVYDNINLVLAKDTANFVEIQSYENLINHIEFQQKDSIIHIVDNNKCNYLRKYDKTTTVTFHYKQISVISLNGNGSVTSATPVENPIIHVYAQSSNSTIDLELKAYSLLVKLINGTVDGKLSGEAFSAEIFHYGDSKVDFKNLNTTHQLFSNKSSADVTLNASATLRLELFTIGTVYYHNNPIVTVLKNIKNSQIVRL